MAFAASTPQLGLRRGKRRETTSETVLRRRHSLHGALSLGIRSIQNNNDAPSRCRLDANAYVTRMCALQSICLQRRGERRVDRSLGDCDPAALRDFNGVHVGSGRRLGHSAISAQMSGLPESGHGWTIYDYTPLTRSRMLIILLPNAFR